MDNPSRLYTIIQEDLPAANGIIHIIDRPITNTLSGSPPRDEQVGLFLELCVSFFAWNVTGVSSEQSVI